MSTHLIVCRSCRRHLFAGEGACPFCGTALQSTVGALALVVGTGLLGAGCDRAASHVNVSATMADVPSTMQITQTPAMPDVPDAPLVMALTAAPDVVEPTANAWSDAGARRRPATRPPRRQQIRRPQETMDYGIAEPMFKRADDDDSSGDK